MHDLHFLLFQIVTALINLIISKMDYDVFIHTSNTTFFSLKKNKAMGRMVAFDWNKNLLT